MISSNVAYSVDLTEKEIKHAEKIGAVSFYNRVWNSVADLSTGTAPIETNLSCSVFDGTMEVKNITYDNFFNLVNLIQKISNFACDIKKQADTDGDEITHSVFTFTTRISPRHFLPYSLTTNFAELYVLCYSIKKARDSPSGSSSVEELDGIIAEKLCKNLFHYYFEHRLKARRGDVYFSDLRYLFEGRYFNVAIKYEYK